MKPDAQVNHSVNPTFSDLLLRLIMTWASGFALFHFLIDLLVDILDKSIHIVDLKSGILNLSKA